MVERIVTTKQTITIELEILHYRNGKLINHVMPYASASTRDKILYWFGLKNLTRGI